MKVRPLHKNILIEPIAARKETASGLVLPHGERSGVSRATVVDVSPYVVGIEAGDTILYGRNAPTVDAGDGKLILSMDHVEAILA